MSPLYYCLQTSPRVSHGLGMGIDIPERFFMDLDDTPPVRSTFGNEGKHGWTPAGAMKWYDDIIDDLLANPGSSMTDCAHRLGRSPSTVQTICASDLFKARWSQRRTQYEELLNQKLVAKLTKTADLALDLTIEVMQKKRDAVPLPTLVEITKSSLDRLGYSPKGDSPQVNVYNTNNVVSAEALAAAREKLKLVEGVVTHGEAVRPQVPREASVRLPGQPGEASARKCEDGEAVVPEDPVAGRGQREGED